jgi:hypothetical protein
MIFPIRFRTCLFHSTTLASSWGGHVHWDGPLGESHIIVGLCKDCSKWEEYEYAINAKSVSNQDKGCKGCYGKYEGSLR